MDCSFETGEHGGFRVLYVRGELDLAVCPEIGPRVLAAAEGPAPCVIVDLLNVPYGEAAPLRSIVDAHNALVARGGALSVVCCAEFMQKIVELAGVHEQVPIFHALQDAAAYLRTVCLP